MRRGRDRNVGGAIKLQWLIGAEAIGDPSFLKIVGGHLHAHTITGENVDAVHAHASREMTVELMTLRLITEDANAKSCIREGLFHNPDELDDILGHRWQERGKSTGKSRGILLSYLSISKRIGGIREDYPKIVLHKLHFVI